MYIYDKTPLEEIRIRLNISRRTLFYWKKKYEWDRKIFEVERNQEIFSEELLDLARKLLQKISKDMDNKTQTPQSEIYSLMNILKNIPQVKQQSIEMTQKQKSKTLSPEHFKQIEKELFGIDF